jgi:hypothetical protein
MDELQTSVRAREKKRKEQERKLAAEKERREREREEQRKMKEEEEQRERENGDGDEVLKEVREWRKLREASLKGTQPSSLSSLYSPPNTPTHSPSLPHRHPKNCRLP